MASFMNSVSGLCTETITHFYEAKKPTVLKNSHALSILKFFLGNCLLEQLCPGRCVSLQNLFDEAGEVSKHKARP